MHLSAHADLWAHVDEQGITHFAATQVDERYKLFYKGSDVTRLNLSGQSSLASSKKSGPGVKPGAGAKGGEPAFVMPKRFAGLDDSRGYKSVQKHLKAAAKAHAVDYELLKAVIAAESGFDPAAVSPKGAVGLMQLLPTTAEQYGVLADKEDRKDRKGKVIAAQTVEQKLADPKTNIFAGARHLAYLMKLFKGDTTLVVAAYNAGEGAVQRAGNAIPKFKETQGYVKTVMGLYGIFKPTPATTVADAGAAAGRSTPVASVVSRVKAGRVRVELAAADKDRATPADNARASLSGTLTEAANALVPVLYTVPADAAVRAAGGE